MGDSLQLRSLLSDLIGRSIFASSTGLSSFKSSRNLNTIFGYNEVITLADCRDRFKRGGIANTIISIFPDAIWIDGIEIVEDRRDPKRKTDFERKANSLWSRLNLTSEFKKADILSRIGSYSAILIGAPDNKKSTVKGLASELPRGNSSDLISYVFPIAEDRATIESLVGDNETDSFSDPRYGLPRSYNIQPITPRSTRSNNGLISRNPSLTLVGKSVHWSRMIHVAHGLLEDRVYGTPLLEKGWNHLDDLYKIAGGGAEATLQRSDPGMHANGNSELGSLNDDEIAELKTQWEEYRLKLRSLMITNGIEITPLSNNIAQFGPNGDFILTLIGATYRIAKRRLTGEELGLRSSETNDDNFNDQVDAEISINAKPMVRAFYDRLIDYGYLPRPRNGYDVVWPKEEEMSEPEKAELALKKAEANKAQSAAGGGLIWESSQILDSLGENPVATSTDELGKTEDSTNA